MSAKYYHDACLRCMHKPVSITTVDGTVHRGIIDRVDAHRVYLRPVPGHGSHHGLTGYGYGFGGHHGFGHHGFGHHGFGHHHGFHGAAVAIALASIAALALWPFFFI